MVRKPRKTTTEVPAELSVNDEPPIEGTLTLTTTSRQFQIRGAIEIDFDELRKSGDLDDSAIRLLESGYPDSPILFMGVLTGISIDGKSVCIGIKTGPHVYPKNMFYISQKTAIKACAPLDGPPHQLKPY